MTRPNATQRMVFATLGAFKYTRADRLDLATVLLDRNIESFNDLDPNEWRRLADACSGAVHVATTHMERKKEARAAAAATPTDTNHRSAS